VVGGRLRGHLAGCAPVRRRHIHWLAALLVVALVACAAPGESRRAGKSGPWVVLRIVRANVSTDGAPANAPPLGATLSADGRYVAFSSGATTLVSGDRNHANDIFVRDLATSTTSRVSVSSRGDEGDGPSVLPSISAAGRFVAFPSQATNLVPGDRNGVQDVFVRDRVTGTTQRVSTGLHGEANGPSLASYVTGNGSAVVFSSAASNLVPHDRNGTVDVFVTQLLTLGTSRASIGSFGEASGRSEASAVSSSGRVVAFRSYAANLVRRDRNGLADVFVRDRRTGVTALGDISSSGAQPDRPTFRGTLSGNGRFVGFRSRATNLVRGDTDGAPDAFVHDRVTGQTVRVSVASDGSQPDANGLDWNTRESRFMSRPFLSADGRYAAFTSRAPNLVPGDRNGAPDVFVHDLVAGWTIRVSVRVDGTEANSGSFVSGISADGRVVAFTSYASNLIHNDSNRHRDVFVAYLGPPDAGSAASS
jgi:WD40 repeat protein